MAKTKVEKKVEVKEDVPAIAEPAPEPKAAKAKAGPTPMPPGTVGVPDLAVEFKMKANKLRGLIRKLGFKAPAHDAGGKFGPRSKYVWDEGSEELAKIRDGIAKSLAPREDVEDAEPPLEDDSE